MTASSGDFGTSIARSMRRLVALATIEPRLAIFQEPRHFSIGFWVADRADALQRPAADVVEPLERKREVGAAARLHHGVDLIDDDGPGPSAAWRRERSAVSSR